MNNRLATRHFKTAIVGDSSFNVSEDYDSLTIHIEGATGLVELRILPDGCSTPRSPNEDGTAFTILANNGVRLEGIGACSGFNLLPTQGAAAYTVSWSQ